MKNKPIFIIAAREGSKRIKNKNIINFFDKPLISYPIRIAIQSKLFEKVVVSTDSFKIAKIAKKYGAEAPFLRKKKLSDDKTGLREVIKDTIKNIDSKNEKYHFYIYATAALLNKNDLIEAFKKIKRLNYDYLISVKKFESNPLRAFKIKDNNLKFNWNKFAKKNTQKLKNLYSDSASFFIFRTKCIFKKNILPNKTTFYEQYRNNALDIDYPEDLKMLKYIYKNKSI
jgi:pseudaminic acid cytidylyltransferase